MFVLELCLRASVEEECDVGILFSFSNMALVNPLLGKPFCKDVGHGLCRESYGESKVALVLSHGGDVQVVGYLDILRGCNQFAQHRGDFAHTIRAVVEAEDSVLVTNQSVLVDNNGLQELIRHILLIIVLNGL